MLKFLMKGGFWFMVVMSLFMTYVQQYTVLFWTLSLVGLIYLTIKLLSTRLEVPQ